MDKPVKHKHHSRAASIFFHLRCWCLIIFLQLLLSIYPISFQPWIGVGEDPIWGNGFQSLQRLSGPSFWTLNKGSSSSDVASVRLVCVQSVANSNFFDSQDREDPTFPNHKGIGTNSPWFKIWSKMSHERSKQHGFCTWFNKIRTPLYQINVPIRLLNFEKKNLDQCFVNIFDQWKLFHLIDLIPGPLYEVKSGINSINWNHFYCSKIITRHRSRFCFSKYGNRAGKF